MDSDMEIGLLKRYLFIELEEALKKGGIFPAAVAFKSMSKHIAELCMEKGRILDGIYHQTESLGVSMRLKSQYRSRTRTTNARNLNPIYLNYKGDYEGTGGMMKRLQELPKEWNVVHITQSYIAKEISINPGEHSKNLTFWISLLPTGNSTTEPLAQRVTYSGRREDSMLTPLEDLARIVADNKYKPKQYYNNKTKYWEVRDAINQEVIKLVNDIETSWLGKWRFLLLGELSLESARRDIMRSVDELLLSHCRCEVSDRTRSLLYRLAAATNLLTEDEVFAVVYDLLDESKGAKNVATQMFHTFVWFISNARKPLVLIVDEVLDIIPWESLSLLAEEPITRVTCLPMLHALYKVHEDDMKGGYKMVDNTRGYHVINPQENLAAMEGRFKQFIPKRMPSWEGVFGKCQAEDFLYGMDKFQVFLYCGHGNGQTLLSRKRIESSDVQSVSLLMGCSSVSMSSLGGRTEYTSVAHVYHNAACPLVIGNLWEVSDLDTDRITAAILHSWVPLGKTMSKDATKYMTVATKRDHYPQRDLLRAVQAGRRHAKNAMTRFGIVARGLPVMAVK